MNLSSSDLIQRLHKGEPEAIDDAVLWYADDVMRLSVLILRDPDEAEDITHETFLKFIRLVKDGKLRHNNGSVKGFLLQCARNQCLNLLKKRKRLLPIEDDSDDEGLQVSSTQVQTVQDERIQEAFDRALSQLPDIQRTILVLHTVNKEPYIEIAKVLNVSIEYVRKNLYRARKKLRILLAGFRGEL